MLIDNHRRAPHAVSLMLVHDLAELVLNIDIRLLSRCRSTRTMMVLRDLLVRAFSAIINLVIGHAVLVVIF